MRKHRCKCGETDPSKFYGIRKNACAKCRNEYTKAKGREIRSRAVVHLGGKCTRCEYDEFECALDIHHVDPSSKDPNFSSMRGWSWDRLLKELKLCILLCKNCHSATHNHDI